MEHKGRKRNHQKNIKRFKLDSASIKQMEESEYELIYNSSPEIINDTIGFYKNKECKLKDDD